MLPLPPCVYPLPVPIGSLSPRTSAHHTTFSCPIYPPIVVGKILFAISQHKQYVKIYISWSIILWDISTCIMIMRIIIKNSFSTYYIHVLWNLCSIHVCGHGVSFHGNSSCLSNCVCLQVCLSADMRFIQLQVVECIN